MSSTRLFEDYNHTLLYKRHRHEYPNELIEHIITYMKAKHDGPYDLAIDVGCGSGQATKLLADHFPLVFGYDVSENQIHQAKGLEDVYKNIKFFVSPSECLDNLKDSSVDLVIVATAIHWFNIDDFFKECKRVLKPNGTLAIWSYYLERFKCANESISQQLTRKLDDFFNFLQPSPKLNHLKTRYRDISPPFQDLVRIDDKFRIKSIQKVDDLMNTIRTWSAYQAYQAKHPQTNCLNAFKLELEAILQDNQFEGELELFLLICRN